MSSNKDSKAKRTYVIDSLTKMLINVNETDYRNTTENLTRRMWPKMKYGPNSDGFLREAKYTSRIISELRHAAYRYIQDQLVARSEAIRRGVKRNDLEPLKAPDFIPFAIQINGKYWTYLNAALLDWPRAMAALQRQRADDLNNTANLIEEGFQVP